MVAVTARLKMINAKLILQVVVSCCTVKHGQVSLIFSRRERARENKKQYKTSIILAPYLPYLYRKKRRKESQMKNRLKFHVLYSIADHFSSFMRKFSSVQDSDHRTGPQVCDNAQYLHIYVCVNK